MDPLERAGVKLAPYAFLCRDFMAEGGYRQVTAVVAPVRVYADEEGATVVEWECNHGEACLNSPCRYSKASRRTS